ncbi:AIR synthase-related protein [Pseudomonas aeruginosa]|nr:AIR synthase-related protein [Pseudomonas aeruginosa]
MQRDNPEMERRCQEVIDRCWQLGERNPISFIHDVGAGGLSNALPELINDGGRGGRFELRAVPNDEPGMSPLEIWSTSRRSATCCRWTPPTSRPSRPSASASAARSRWSARPSSSAS